MNRIEGIDVARGLAILGMFVAHLGYVSAATGWFVVADGRSSALFAIIAGIGLAFMTQRAWGGEEAQWHAQRVRIGKRAGWIFLFGWFLTLLGTPIAVILSSYALMFFLVLPFLRWRPRRLLLLAAVWLAVAQLPVLAAKTAIESGPGPGSLWRIVPVVGELLTGYYPAISWSAYLLIGLAIGRLPLRRLSTAWALSGVGAVVAFVGYGGSALFSAATGAKAEAGSGAGSGAGYSSDFVAKLLSTAPHTDSAIEMFANAGVACVVIGLALVATRLRPVRFILSPVAAAGAMSLTVYSAHVIAVALMGREFVLAPGWNLPLLLMIVCSLLFASLWRKFAGQGPLEGLLHHLTGPSAALPTPPQNTLESV